jgi:5,6,7,8-tetrahydromethanopterin hydro-lyase
MELGECFVGSGPNAAHLNTMLGTREGPVGQAWATALATPRAGHAAFVTVLQPGLPVRPFTLFVNKATIDGDDHAQLTWGAAQAGVAAGVADTVAGGILTEEEAETLVLVAAVWVDPRADDPDKVYANNREATRGAIIVGRSNLPAARDAASKRNEAFNPFFRPPDRSGAAAR